MILYTHTIQTYDLSHIQDRNTSYCTYTPYKHMTPHKFMIQTQHTAHKHHTPYKRMTPHTYTIQTHHTAHIDDTNNMPFHTCKIEIDDTSHTHDRNPLYKMQNTNTRYTTRIEECMYMHMYICIYIHVYVYVHMCIYTQDAKYKHAIHDSY